MMKRDISANLYQKCLILCSKILLNVLFNTNLTVPHIKSFFGHLCCSILMFVNSTSYAWSSKHIDLLARVCGLVLDFGSWKSLTYWNKVGGDCQKRVSCHGNIIFYSHRCVSRRTISLPCFNVLHCKLAKKAPFICLK